MKIYKVKVNGKSYRVELESIEQVASEAQKETKKVEKAAAAPVASSGEGRPVESPIQGSVVNVKVSVGQSVKKGDALVVVEAMKLENDVVSPFDGTVAEILVKKGDNVTAKQVIATIKQLWERSGIQSSDSLINLVQPDSLRLEVGPIQS